MKLFVFVVLGVVLLLSVCVKKEVEVCVLLDVKD